MGAGLVANVSLRLYTMYLWGVPVSIEDAQEVKVSVILLSLKLLGD